MKVNIHAIMNAVATWTIFGIIHGCVPALQALHDIDSNDDIDSYYDKYSIDDIDSDNNIDRYEERLMPWCTVPEHPKHGRYELLVSTLQDPGPAQPFLFINTTCEPGYVVVGKPHFTCHNGDWSTETFPTCTRTCIVEQSRSVEYRCIITEFPNSEGTRDCNEFVPEGTVIHPHCRGPNYYSITELPNLYCRDGSWNYIPRCEPICGRMPPGADLRSAPWVVLIYYYDGNSWNQIATGNLISRNAVVSAAHYLWDEQSGKLPADRLAIVAGKRHRQWQHPLDDARVQRSRVKFVDIPKNYYGADLSYENDLSVLVLETPVEWTEDVMPACINFDEAFVEQQLRPGNIGTTSVWIQTPGMLGSEPGTLQMLQMPYVPFDECIKRTPPDFRSELAGGKFCAGYGKESTPRKSDSGGAGLTFAVNVLGEECHYLIGVTSATPARYDRVDLNAPTIFEPVAKHAKMIKKHWDPYY